MSEGTAKGMDDGAAAPAGLRRLFSPLMVGGVELRNRIVSTAHSTGLTDGTALSDALVAYYAARARGGVGLIVTGSTSVHPTSSSRLRPALANWDDGIVAPYRRLAAAVHAHGARIFAQLNHAGALSGAGGLPGGRPLAPSVIDLEKAEAPPRALLEPEIAEIVAAFAAAAARARDGGLDGIELHGGHGNLIQQFLSPHTNRRDDAYGGPLENRLRFAREVAVAVRAAVGPDFTVGLRLSAEEDYPDGLFLPETRVWSRRRASTMSTSPREATPPRPRCRATMRRCICAPATCATSPGPSARWFLSRCWRSGASPIRATPRRSLRRATPTSSG